MNVKFTVGGSEAASAAFSYSIGKNFDKDTIEQLDKVTNITFENGGKYTMKPYEERSIMPEIEGADEGALRVIRTGSSTPSADALIILRFSLGMVDNDKVGRMITVFA